MPRLRELVVRGSAVVWALCLCIGSLQPNLGKAAVKAPEKPSQPKSTIGKVIILPVRFTGDIPEFVRTQLGGNVFDGLSRDQDMAGDLEAVDLIDDCSDASCWEALAKQLEANYFVRTEVTKTGPDHRVRIEAIDGATGETIATTGGYCEICGSQELAQLVADQSAALSPRVHAVSNRMAYLVVDGTQQAEVWIDGLAVGKLPYEVEVRPGVHSIKIIRRGYASQSREWIARVQIREHMNFELARESRLAERPIWGWLSLGIGLGAGAAGGTLLAIDNRPHMPSCPPQDRDRDGRCPNRYDTFVGGMVTTAVGAAGIGIGIGLLVHQRRQMNRSAGASAQLVAMPNGLAVTGQF